MYVYLFICIHLLKTLSYIIAYKYDGSIITIEVYILSGMLKAFVIMNSLSYCGY